MSKRKASDSLAPLVKKHKFDDAKEWTLKERSNWLYLFSHVWLRNNYYYESNNQMYDDSISRRMILCDG
jgi:hypothetical protein